MTKTYRSWEPEQTSLFPPSPRDWLPEDHLVYFLLDTVAEIDLGPIFAHYERETRGHPPFHPRLMVSLLLYCYCTGTFSSRRIQARCATDLACRIIVAEDIPDFRTISDFRKTHLNSLEGLFVEVLRLCAAAGLVKVGRIALDGTKVKANASRHKAMSYDRMQEEEHRLQKEVAELLHQAQATDDHEDAEHGPNRRGDELPAELARRQSRLAKIREAKAALEAEARAKAAAEEDRRQAEGKPPSGRDPSAAEPEPKAQRNFTDPESKIMKVSNKGFDQCGNAQAVVTAGQIILAADVTAEANDQHQVVPMLNQTCANLDAAGVEEPIRTAMADSGYSSAANLECLEDLGIDAYIATGRLKHHERIPPGPRGRCPAGLSAKQRMARKLRTKKGRALYALRKGMIEPVFGQIKQVRGFRQFLLRGLEKIRGEWRLVCLTHNLLKLYRRQVSLAG
jgi:transposase